MRDLLEVFVAMTDEARHRRNAATTAAALAYEQEVASLHHERDRAQELKRQMWRDHREKYERELAIANARHKVIVENQLGLPPSANCFLGISDFDFDPPRSGREEGHTRFLDIYYRKREKQRTQVRPIDAPLEWPIE